MVRKTAILLFVDDRPVLSSLQFSLAVEGFEVVDGVAGGANPSAAAAVVIDQAYRADGLASLADLRAKGCITPAIVLATNPTAQLRATVAAAGAALIEKPLLGDDLTSALRTVLDSQEAA